MVYFIHEYEELIREKGLRGIVSLYDNYPNNTSFTNIMIAALQTGNLDVIKWISQVKPEEITSSDMYIASRNGHLHIVQWLHENIVLNCTTAAMDYAAMHGHLETVKWLHNYRSEGCTNYAMDFAAMNGHYEVIEWLHKNRKEGCTVSGIRRAIEHNHLDIAFYLLKQYPINIVRIYDKGYQSLLPLIQKHFREVFMKIRADVMIKRFISKKIVYHPSSPYIRRLIQTFT